MARFVTGPPGRAAHSGQGEFAGDPEFEAKFPALWEYLTLDIYEDGKHRDRATLQLLFEDGRWKGCCNDRSANRSVWTTGETIGDVIGSLEAALASGGAAWRYYEPWGKKKGKGR